MKDIPGYEGQYAITRDGRTWSYPKKIHKGKWLVPDLRKNGYLFVSLTKNRIRKGKLVHRLVALTYLDQDPLKKYINKNNIKTDNRVENLEWCTPSENGKHWYASGLWIPTEKFIKSAKKLIINNHARRKLTEEQVRQLRKESACGISYCKLGIKYRISATSIGAIVKHKTYKEII